MRNTKQKIVKERFVYVLAEENGDKTEIVLPSLSFIPPRMTRELRKLSDIDAMFTLIEEYLTRDEMDLFDATIGEDPEEFESFMAAWQEHSGVDLGKSSRSTR